MSKCLQCNKEKCETYFVPPCRPDSVCRQRTELCHGHPAQEMCDGVGRIFTKGSEPYWSICPGCPDCTKSEGEKTGWVSGLPDCSPETCGHSSLTAQPQGGKELWEEDYENEKQKFLIYDKASGSRWLNDEPLKSFIRQVEQEALERGRKEGGYAERVTNATREIEQVHNAEERGYSRGLSDMAAAGREAIEKRNPCKEGCHCGVSSEECRYENYSTVIAAFDSAAKNLIERV